MCPRTAHKEAEQAATGQLYIFVTHKQQIFLVFYKFSFSMSTGSVIKLVQIVAGYSCLPLLYSQHLQCL